MNRRISWTEIRAVPGMQARVTIGIIVYTAPEAESIMLTGASRPRFRNISVRPTSSMTEPIGEVFGVAGKTDLGLGGSRWSTNTSRRGCSGSSTANMAAMSTTAACWDTSSTVTCPGPCGTSWPTSPHVTWPWGWLLPEIGRNRRRGRTIRSRKSRDTGGLARPPYSDYIIDSFRGRPGVAGRRKAEAAVQRREGTERDRGRGCLYVPSTATARRDDRQASQASQ